MSKLYTCVSAISIGIVAIIMYFLSTYSQYEMNDNIYRGRIEFGLDHEVFLLCASDEEWAISGLKNEQLWDLYKGITRQEAGMFYGGDIVYAEVNGTLSQPGKYGMGFYEREILVTKVLSLSTSRPPQC